MKIGKKIDLIFRVSHPSIKKYCIGDRYDSNCCGDPLNHLDGLYHPDLTCLLCTYFTILLDKRYKDKKIKRKLYKKIKKEIR